MSVYTWPWYYAAGNLAVVGLIASWSWFDLRRRGFNATVGVACLLALAALTLRLPSYFLEEIRIDQHRMSWRIGPWWAVAEGSVRLEEVQSVRIEKRPQAGIRRNRGTEKVWVLLSAGGPTDELVVSPLWQEHYPDIKGQFVAMGIGFAGPD